MECPLHREAATHHSWREERESFHGSCTDNKIMQEILDAIPGMDYTVRIACVWGFFCGFADWPRILIDIFTPVTCAQQ